MASNLTLGGFGTGPRMDGSITGMPRIAAVRRRWTAGFFSLIAACAGACLLAIAHESVAASPQPRSILLADRSTSASPRPDEIPGGFQPGMRPARDGRAVQRWNISEAQPPGGGEVRFRDRDIWVRYRLEAFAVAVLVVLQSALIVGLLYEHRRRREAEELARKEFAELAHMNRLATAGELSASIAHEINQPLAGIVAYAEAGRNWLSRPVPDIAEARDKFEQIVGAGHRAAEVIERIRAFFKKADPVLESLNVNDLVRDVLVLVGADLRRRKVAVELALTEGLPLIRGDRVQLQQVILNLLVNAADAMDSVTDRERRLQVTSRRDGDGDVQVDVQDSGSGVALDDIERVFAPFYTTKAKGMGMGLSISRSLIEAHDGTLKAQRAEPYGMIFSFVLPPLRARKSNGHPLEGGAGHSSHAA
jgi:signal transduction histidine kinase